MTKTTIDQQYVEKLRRFETNVTVQQIAEQITRLKEWTQADILNMAKGKSRKDIFKMFNNTPLPIATLPKEYLQYFSDQTNDIFIYCSEAYFLDHAINHHPELNANEYNNIQNIILESDEIIKDTRFDPRTNKKRDNLIFIKKYEKNRMVVISLIENEIKKMIVYKTLMPTKEKPYPSLSRIQPVSVDGVPTIGQANDKNIIDARGSLSARD